MSEQDRIRWDDAYASREPALAPELPAVFAPYETEFPHEGTALDIACGSGSAAVWLALRGLDVHGVDVSGVAIERARTLAHDAGVAQRCRFDTMDLDDGLPPGPVVDVVLCHRFRDRRLDRAIIDRLAPGGLLAISALSEVGGVPGPFRAVAGELPAAFAALDPIAAGEGDGQAWLLARR
ncbi:bifunctional 2-polyprenyl-6-hydroxyphenol methylase/3-demethylubiquinol 3-O-methyltransferase UbiG [Mycobacterium sp. URHB0044]|uniref:class I SAM-dependent methyltransferase n=1 Tax=Mycobacterium sp. URHB0044 TaxID=1380386 RepID=UPI00048F902F|nr:class I SAM-dependent methyltransferase [Mycobacterium sp. URHB0044]